MELLGCLVVFCNGSSLVVVGCLSVPPCCNCLIILINESRKSSYYCQSLVPLALTSLTLVLVVDYE